MEIIDAQVHAWDKPSKQFPWDPDLGGRLPSAVRTQFAQRPVTTVELVAMMNAVGVDGALLTSPTVYGADHAYVFSAAAAFPGRFGVVAPLYPSTAEVEARVHSFRNQANGVGVRVVVLPWWGDEPLTSDGFGKIFGAAEQARVPIFAAVPGRMRELAEVARRYPELTIVVEHLGLNSFDTDAPPLSRLHEVLELARFDNLVIKCVAAPQYSDEPYPFNDLWPYLTQLIDAFGLERLIWGTDVTQHMQKHTYCEMVDYIRASERLSESEKELLLGRNLRRLLWPGKTSG